MFSPPCFTFYLNLEPNLVLKENNQNKCIKKKYYFDINADWKKKKNARRKFLQQPKIIFRGNVKSVIVDDTVWQTTMLGGGGGRCRGVKCNCRWQFLYYIAWLSSFHYFFFPLFIYSLCNGNNVLSNQQLRKIQYNSD